MEPWPWRDRSNYTGADSVGWIFWMNIWVYFVFLLIYPFFLFLALLSIVFSVGVMKGQCIGNVGYEFWIFLS